MGWCSMQESFFLLLFFHLSNVTVSVSPYGILRKTSPTDIKEVWPQHQSTRQILCQHFYQTKSHEFIRSRQRKKTQYTHPTNQENEKLKETIILRIDSS